MEKVKVFDKEYNCSKRVYYHIKGLESEKRYLKMEVNIKDKQIINLQNRIDKVLDFINAWKDNKTELKVSMLDLLQIEDILRGNDEENKK